MRTSILTTMLALVLSSGMIAQVASTPAGHLVVSNTSDKEVIAFVVAYTTKEGTITSPMIHDFYFKPQGVMAGMDMDLTDHFPVALTFTSAKLLFIQYADGSISGDANDPTAKAMLDRRPVTKAFTQALLDSYRNGGEQAFLKRLNAETKNSDWMLRVRAKIVLQWQQRDGTQAVLDRLNEKVNAAKARTF